MFSASNFALIVSRSIHHLSSTFDVWHRTLELDKPEVFLKKLSGAVDQLVDDKWWIDRDTIRAKLEAENTH